MNNRQIGLIILICLICALTLCVSVIADKSRESWEVLPTSSSGSEQSGSSESSVPVTTSGKADPEAGSEETKSSGDDKSKKPDVPPEDIMIDINKAGADKLTELDGIGDTLAKRIVEYRDSHGGFRNIEEIMLVKGIGEGKFNNIKDHIFVENPVYETTAATEARTASPTKHKEPHTDSPPEEIPPVVTDAPATEIAATEFSTQPSSGMTLEEAVPIDINTASREELMLLPHVTEEVADGIIQLRGRLHGFSNVYELLYVDGLKQNEVAEIIKFVTVGE